MCSPHRIAIAFLSVFIAGNPLLAATSPGNGGQVPTMVDVSGFNVSLSSPLIQDNGLGPDATRSVPNALRTAGTSEPPGPGCPSIPGGPGPLPDDDDDDDA